MDSFLPVIFVDDDSHIRDSVGQTLELADLESQLYASARQALYHISPQWPGIVVSDINMSPMNGLDLMKAVHDIDPDLPVILVTGHGDITMAVNAMRDGAYDFIEKPFTGKRLVSVIKRALERRTLVLENRSLRQELEAQAGPGPRILGNTASMKRLRAQISQIVNAPADILIWGDTGTGKELVARYLHEHSSRRKGNFVAINCGAVPENLIESELFGHEAGAFTGADKTRVGKFEHANGGTLFLDEIESMPISLQVKILRILEERQVERLGSNELLPLDLRIVAATKVDLKRLSETAEFRLDLYYRLNLVTLKIPALKERLEDVPLLFEHFALIAAARYQRELCSPEPGYQDALLQHHWPGNVRELRNAAERYVLTGGMDAFEYNEKDSDQELQSRQSLQERVEQFERMVIEQTLRESGGKINDTVVGLGVARKTLYDKMKKYNLAKESYR